MSQIKSNNLLNKSHKYNQQKVNNQSCEKDWQNITSYKPLTINTLHKIYTIALSLSGKYVASAGWDDYSIKIWDPITGNQVGSNLNGHQARINQINYSKCGDFIVSASWDQTIRQWDVSNHKQFGQAVLMKTQLWELISCSMDQTIRLWDPKSGKQYSDKRIQHMGMILCLSLSPISNEVAYEDDEGKITIRDYEKLQKSGQQLNGHKKCVHSVKYSSNGNIILSGSYDKTISLWDVLRRIQIRSYIGHTPFVYQVNFSPNQIYISSLVDGIIQLDFGISQQDNKLVKVQHTINDSPN